MGACTQPKLRDFDGRALHAALDARRREEGLSWAGAAAAVWDMSALLNAARDARGRTNHPISPATLRGLGRRGDTSCQHALFFLRWLERTPESFLAGAELDAGAPLPACGRDRRPRFDLGALHGALEDARRARGVTWGQLAQELRCQPGRLTGLKTARFATGMGLAMRAAQWLDRPVADFVYLARW